MERHRQIRDGSQSQAGCSGAASDAGTLSVLQRYSAGEISARQAAKAIGPKVTEHDVFAGILAAQLPLPVPPAADVEREVAALAALYGPHGPRPRV